jgi:hypothetical protein
MFEEYENINGVLCFTEESLKSGAMQTFKMNGIETRLLYEKRLGSYAVAQYDFNISNHTEYKTFPSIRQARKCYQELINEVRRNTKL